MDLFFYSGFQTVEFALMAMLAARALFGGKVDSRFLVVWGLSGLAGLAALQVMGGAFPALPFFVSFWRMLFTVVGAAFVNAFFTEWRSSPGGLFIAHALGIACALTGTGLVWQASWEVSSAALMMLSFLLLGYCARENRLRRPR